jgi:heme A synthase
MRGYPPRFTQLLWAVCGLLLVSGLLLLPTTLQMRADIEVPWRLPGDARIWTAALHTLGAFLMLALAGALWSIHMRAGWRRKRHRRSGATLVLIVLALLLSAVGVFYLGESRWADVAAGTHAVLGLSFLPPIWLHRARGRRDRTLKAGAARGR